MKKKILLPVIVAFFIVSLAIVWKIIPREQDRVRRDIMSLKKSVEQKHKTEVIKYVDSSYVDNHGLTYQDLMNAIQDLFNQFDSPDVIMSGLTISIDSTVNNTVWASCSLGLKVFARYGEDRVLVYGGIIKPSPVKALLKKTTTHYTVVSAEY